MNLLKLWEITKKIFLEEDKFQMKKVITDFNSDGKFLWDFFSFLIREEIKNESPIFYSVVSPFDAIWKTEAYSSNIYRDGKILYSWDFSKYTAIRTGLLVPLIIDILKVNIQNKKTIIIWTGKLAKNGVQAMYAYYPNISEIFYTNHSWRKKDFEDVFKDYPFTLTYVKKPNFIEYDYITFYTNAKESILKKTSEIKDGAIISSHISSTDFAEYSDEVYKEWNVIVDWRDNLSSMKDIQRALEKKYLKKEEILSLREVLEWKSFKNNKRYTLIRSTGTPMQNIAVLKYLWNK